MSLFSDREPWGYWQMYILYIQLSANMSVNVFSINTKTNLSANLLVNVFSMYIIPGGRDVSLFS